MLKFQQTLFLLLLSQVCCLPPSSFMEYEDRVSQSSDDLFSATHANIKSDAAGQSLKTAYYVKEFFISQENGYYSLIIELNQTTRYVAHVLEKPDRLYIDLYNTTINSSTQSIPINDGLIRCVRTGQYTSTTARIVLDTTEKVAYHIAVDQASNRLIVYFYSQKAKPPVPVPSFNPAIYVQQESEKNSQMIPQAAMDSNCKPSLARELGLKVRTIIIDPGHGGKDPGAVSPVGVEEKEITLAIALKLQELLLNEGTYRVLLTRNDDTFIPLEERTAFANGNKGDLFISIHVNAHSHASRDGIETYYLSLAEDEESRAVAAYENRTATTQFSNLDEILSNIIKNSKIEESTNFAEIVQKNLIQRTQQTDRGVKKAGFVVLIHANMPSILVEAGFLTHAESERLLQTSAYQKLIAEAIFQGIKQYTNELVALSPHSNQF